MPVVTLTDLTIRNLKPVPGRQVTYVDKSLKGFGIRVTENGIMSYVLTMGANRQRIKIADVGVVKLSDARTKAKTLLAEKQLGVHKPTASPTFEDATKLFLEAAEKRTKPRTLYDYRRLLARHFSPFNKLRVADITPQDIQTRLDRLTETASEQAHAYAAAQIFFRFCVRRQFLDQNPMTRMERPARQGSRSRILTDDELKAIWNACEGMFGAIIRLCILLGQRRSELAQLRWEWLDGNLLTFPAHVTKNKREHRIPIGPTALAIISDQPRVNGYVFPARKNWSRGKQATVYNAWGKDKPKLDQRSGVTDWVIHDLRRTLVSGWAAIGVRLEVTEKYINHVSGSTGGIIGVYMRHTFLEEQKHAVSQWEAKLVRLAAQGST
jgi:integrase